MKRSRRGSTRSSRNRRKPSTTSARPSPRAANAGAAGYGRALFGKAPIMKTALALLGVAGALALAAEPPPRPKPMLRQQDRWEKPLIAAAAGADLLVVESLRERDPAKRRKFELKGAEKIATLWAVLEIDAGRS